MADLNHSGAAPLRGWRVSPDRVWLSFGGLILLLALLVPGDLPGIAADSLRSLAGTLPFIVFAVGAIAFMRASGAEALVARAFQGRESRMIVLAALVGGLAPFCSCEVIPFVAAMLALGAPLSAAMAFWLASPLMDPAMFMITAAALGLPFALAKLAIAVCLGLCGGFCVKLLAATPAFIDPLRPERKGGGGCCATSLTSAPAPEWRFWAEQERRAIFGEAARENGLFLVKWLSVAYLLEAVMTRYMPAEWVASVLGGEGPGTVLLAAALGAPAYLNGYAAPALVSGLMEQGMSAGAAMAFVVAGGVSCIPAAIAVWALVRPRVFAGYIGLAMTGALAGGLIWGAVA